jgi:hypothetical protein
MGSSTPDVCFISDIDNGRDYYFQFMPASISDSKSAAYADYAIQGRSSPLKGYQHSPSRTLSFTVKMWAQPTQDDESITPSKIKDDVDFLRSLVYPSYSGGIKPPPRCHILIGANIEMFGVCKNVQVNYDANQNVWDLGPGFAHGPTVALVFEEIAVIPLDTFDVRGGGTGLSP